VNPYFEAVHGTLYQGDALSVLQALPSESVQCCVTSPPYYGLRDYGTGKWIGGDPDCKHRCGNQVSDTIAPHVALLGVRPGVKAKKCIVCGAFREDNQIGLEETPEIYIERLVAVFGKVRRVLRVDGTLWLNIGDSYAGSGSGKGGQSDEKRSDNWQPEYANKGKTYGLKPKDLIGIPWMLGFALRADGWYLRQDIIWAKPNPMPESVKDRCTRSHEHIFLLSRSAKYYFNNTAMREKAAYDGRKDTAMKGSRKYSVEGVTGIATQPFASRGHERWTMDENGEFIRNRRDVWTVSTKACGGAHFATFPPDLIRPCILAGSREGDTVLDPFFGSGTTGMVARQLGRKWMGIELNADYGRLALERIGSNRLRLAEAVG
jgi:DNA modification methylase